MHQRLNDPLIGALIDGRYFVESRLARGGMSTVYLAVDRRLDRRVALKVLFPHLAEDRTFLDRFEQEAKSAARLAHPHVVGVLDQGIDEGSGRSTAYLVMEYVPGRTLRHLLQERGRLTPRQALAMMDPVIEGLAAAHEAGLVHRDVKPENVLLASSGQIKIADFGLARAVTATTGTATLVGTAAYLPPELVTGSSADARSDIYSAGIVLFELLTGRQPYTGDAPVQIAFQHAYERVPAPSVFLPGLAEDLDELVQWCTSRDPEDRPVDGTALLGELRHIRTTLTDAELDYSPPGPPRASDGPRTAEAGSPAGGSFPVGATEVIGARTPGNPTEVIGARTPGNPTEVIGARTPGNPTEVIGARTPGNPTEVIGAPTPTGLIPLPRAERDIPQGELPDRDEAAAHSPTRIFPREPSVPPGGRGADTPTREIGMADRRYGATAPAERPQPVRQPRPASRSQQRKQARAAQRPVKALRTRRSAQWQAAFVVLLVLLAVLTATAGWLLGTGQAGTGPHLGTGLPFPHPSGAERVGPALFGP